MKYIYYLLLIIFITSCNASKLTQPHKIVSQKLEAGAFYMLPLDASVKSNLIRTNADGSFRILSEAAPDAIVTSIVELTTKLAAKLKSGETFTAEQITKITESTTQLGKRTAAVNILRDALFRLEEFNQNRTVPMDTSTYNLFVKVLDNVREISLAESAVENAKGKKADLDKEKETTMQEKYKNDTYQLKILQQLQLQKNILQ